MATPPLQQGHESPQDAASASEPRAAQRPPLVRSDELMRGQRAIEISHNGVLYRLQATRLGKLILTK
ncbi:hemin uptake protein HemP [Ramlibacter rhizophilus]|uniref:Hemin uptake protein HemP n=1 Tax=Ramlibacter rhizophilus TaxID=1781167 RepID=A0A4Z0BE24_9BURK|nr:hemin uptake protein HemP [Ramlibacter rhizophilus]TFY96723.1 hemin uptake protein HemP [Ramlibacter rhizophilus]